MLPLLLFVVYVKIYTVEKAVDSHFFVIVKFVNLKLILVKRVNIF